METPRAREDELKSQSETLQNLEEAAAETTDPRQIEQKASTPAARAQSGSRWWFVPYLVFAVIVGGALMLLDWRDDSIRASLAEKLRRYLLGAGALCLVLAVAKAIEIYLIARMRNPVSRFNLRRIFRLIVAIVVALIVISVLFVNWYTAVVSFGLISLIRGVALHTPISSLIAWI